MASAAALVPPPTDPAKMDEIINRVAGNKQNWAVLPASTKYNLLLQMQQLLKLHKDEWYQTSAIGHGYDLSNPKHAHMVGETIVVGPAIFGAWIDSLLNIYKALADTGSMPPPLAVTERPNGVKRVKVAPWGIRQGLFLNGHNLEVVVEKGQVEQFNPCTLPAGVYALLGAGNFDSPNDVLHALFLENKVAILKSNPVNNHSSAAIAKVLQPLISGGFLAVVHGAIEQGQILINHPAVDEVLMTGSARSYDRIVWGNNEQKKGEPSFKKPVKAELGSVNPYIICPGQWSEAEMNEQASLLVAAKLFNSSHVCASPQVVITSRNWPQRDAFLARVRELLKAAPGGRSYYPGADKSYETTLKRLNEECKEQKVEIVEKTKIIDSQQSPIFAPGVSQEAFTCQNECFCPVLTEVPLDVAPTAAEFLPKAVDFAHSLWGSLTCCLIVDPRVYAANTELVEQTIDSLKFGMVGVNDWAGLGFFHNQLSWGGYPRHNIQDIQSGIGIMGNSFCIKNVTKSIYRNTFSSPAHMKVADSAAIMLKSQCVVNYTASPSIWSLLRLVVNGVTGW